MNNPNEPNEPNEPIKDPEPAPEPEQPSAPAPAPAPEQPSEPAPAPEPEQPSEPAPAPEPEQPSENKPEEGTAQPSENKPEEGTAQPAEPAPVPAPEQPTEPAPQPPQEPAPTDKDVVPTIKLEEVHDTYNSTWIHPQNPQDDRAKDPNLTPHKVYRVSGGQSTTDGAYVTPEKPDDGPTAKKKLALGNWNTATEITEGVVYTDPDGNIVDSDHNTNGQKFTPTTVKPLETDPNTGGGTELKLEDPNVVQKQTTRPMSGITDRDLSWALYSAREKEVTKKSEE